MKLHFIVGMSRAGTTWLAKTLNEHSDAVVIGETSFFGRAWEEPRAGTYGGEQLEGVIRRYTGRRGRVQVFFGELGMLGDGPGTYRHIREANCQEVLARAFADIPASMTPKQVFERIADNVAEAEGKSVVIEKTPHHLNWVDRINASFPDAKFVVLFRDAYGFMRSYKHYVQSADALDSEGRNLNYHPAACALIWRGYVRASFDVLARHPDRALRLDFEHMTKKPVEALEVVQDFLGLPREAIAERVPPDNSSFGGLKPQELEPDDLFWMNTVAAPELRRMGIEPKSAPIRPAAMVRSVGALAPFTYRAMRMLSAKTQGSVLAYLRRWVAQ